MEDTDRTIVWRRQHTVNDGPATEQVNGEERVVEPVRDRNSSVNVNQQAGRTPYVNVGPTATQIAVWRAQRIIYYIFGVIEAFIAIRFILKLLDANPTSAFTQIIYGISWIFVFPFNNVVPNFTSGGTTFEWFSLIALMVYVLISAGLAKLVALLL
jgi:hypothetical protein